MSLTISELEAERAKLLDAIESHAQKISSQKPEASEEGHSLKDWLSAAEDIMPNKTPPSTATAAHAPEDKPFTNLKPNKSSFFGVIIMLSLLLTVLGVVYIAYISIQKELQSVVALKDETNAKIQLLQGSMDELQQSVAAGGKSEYFISLEDRVLILQSQINEIQQKLNIESGHNTVQDMPAENVDADVAKKPNKTDASEVTKAAPAKTDSNDYQLVTEAILEQKLKSFSDQLEQKIDEKLDAILKRLSPEASMESNKPAAPSATKDVSQNIQAPTPPVSAEVKAPIIAQTSIDALKPAVTSPSVPATPDEPIGDYTQDVKWLLNESPQNYTLQLASTDDRTALERMIRQKKLRDSKIISQVRDGETSFVLVTGSFINKRDADQLARDIKTDFGISPWVRKVRDITRRIQ